MLGSALLDETKSLSSGSLAGQAAWSPKAAPTGYRSALEMPDEIRGQGQGRGFNAASGDGSVALPLGFVAGDRIVFFNCRFLNVRLAELPFHALTVWSGMSAESRFGPMDSINW
jgi:hypothetical protein